jgi:WD40 repeat protein
MLYSEMLRNSNFAMFEGDNGRTEIWDRHEAKIVLTLDFYPTESNLCVNKEFIAYVKTDNRISVFNTKLLIETHNFPADISSINKLFLTSNHLFTTTRKGLLTMFRLSDCFTNTFEPIYSEINSLIVEDLGRYAITGGGNLVCLWDLSDCLLLEKICGHSHISSSLLTTASQDYVIFASWKVILNNWYRQMHQQPSINLFNTSKKRMEIKIAYEVGFPFGISMDSRFLCYFTANEQFQTWAFKEAIEFISENEINTMMVIDENTFVLERGGLFFHDRRTLKEICSFEPNECPVSEIIILAKEEQKLVIVANGVELYVVDLQEKTFKQIRSEHEDQITGVCCVGKTLISIGVDGLIVYWDLTTGEMLSKHNYPELKFTAIATSPNTADIFLAEKNRGICKLSDDNEPIFISNEGKIWPTCICINEILFVYGCCDGKITYQNLESDEEFTFQENRHAISNIRISDNSKYFLYVSDKIVRIWDLNLRRHIFSVVGISAEWASDTFGIIVKTSNNQLSKFTLFDSDIAGISKKSILLMTLKSKIRLK